MLNIGPAELLVVMVVALLVLGPTKLPDAARQVGRAIGEMRRLSSGFQAEMRDALKEPVDTTPASGSTASSPGSAASKAIGASSSSASNGAGALAAPRPPVASEQSAPADQPAGQVPAERAESTPAPAGDASDEPAEPGTDGASTT